VQDCAGLEGTAQQNGDCAVFVSPVRKALGAQPSRAEIMQGCASLGVLAQRNGDHAFVHLWHGRP
jgi:hypothetical protein